MSALNRPTIASPAFLRTLALTALMSTTMLVSPLIASAADAPAQQTQGVQKSPNRAATGMKGETVEARITTLHRDLKITANEQAKWDAVATAMRDNAARMEKLVAVKQAQKPENLTAVDDLATYEEFAQVHLTGLKNLSVAFKSLYESMPDVQKKNADKVFVSFGQTTAQSGNKTANGAPKKS
jgi:hypothetical protein